jgi:protocatechuate 3,4-dioxygenase, beta subunit
MHRRTFLIALPVVTTAIALAPSAGATQDVEFIRAWERAQTFRPRTLRSHARIAPAGEPGTPMIIHGRIVQRDGHTPAPGIIVFAYHTAADGLYDDRSQGPHSWRLKGWARTGHDGRFEFATIRPAPYPRRAEAAHVHISIEGPGLSRRWAEAILFEDDPLVTRDARVASTKAGIFGSVRPVSTQDGVQHIDFNIRISESGVF